MESLHTIWRFLSRSLAVLLVGCVPLMALADCLPLVDGIYVADSDGDAQIDGGQWSRVKEQVTSSSLDRRFRATTFQFGNVIVVANSKASLYRLISNAPDSRHESLSIHAAVAVANGCDGRFTLDFQVTAFYPNEIAIGSVPVRPGRALTYPLTVHKEGYMLPGGHWRITACQAKELRKRGWRDTRDDLGMCVGAREGYTLFNIQQAIRGIQEWRALDRR